MHDHSKAQQHHEQRTKWVVIITFVTMVVEIVFGISTQSMALLADGIHMGSHVLAIGMSWLAYVAVRRLRNRPGYAGTSGKILSLSGYSSGLMLLIFAVYIMVEAIQRMIHPLKISFREAIIVASAGLVVNLLCALLLKHEHEDSDHNIRAAYLHVLADALTSVTAIVGLTAALLWNIVWFDAVCALISSLVIIRWSLGLLRSSGKVLLDMPENRHSS
jgi:cation diffusion facilitator family transporter